MDKNNGKRIQKEQQENLLMFCGAALMAAGPAFWFLMSSAVGTRVSMLTPEEAEIADVMGVTVALMFFVTGAALALAGWGLSVWYAWRALK